MSLFDTAKSRARGEEEGKGGTCRRFPGERPPSRREGQLPRSQLSSCHHLPAQGEFLSLLGAAPALDALPNPIIMMGPITIT